MRRWSVAAGVIALVVAACGGDGDEAGDDSAGSDSIVQNTATAVAPVETSAPAAETTGGEEAGDPVDGGSLAINLSIKAGLDPIKLSNASSLQGFVEFAAIYDTIVRYNPDTREFEWRTGEFIPNSDYTTWTLELKPGIKFQDGTDYDAAAVAFHVERLQTPEATSGTKNLLLAFLESTKVVDPLTVEFTLKQPWTGFPNLFTKELGMIPSPTQVQERGADFDADPGPSGAGPFQLVSYAPGEEMVVERNPTYWGEPAHLDTITFKLIGGGDPTLMYEQLSSGGVDLFMSDSLQIIQTAEERGDVTMVKVTSPANGSILVNSFTIPTKARQAMQLAVDPAVISQRAFQGLLAPTSQVFDSNFPYYPDVPGTPFDPEKATQLVAEAKAEGWDGKVRVSSWNSAQNTTIAQTVVAMLANVGIDATTDLKDYAAWIAQVAGQKDFELAVGFAYTMTYSPYENFGNLYKTFNSTSPRFGYSSPDMDAALDLLRESSTDAEFVAAFKAISEVWNRDVPSIVYGDVTYAWIGTEKVHGIELSTYEAMMPGGLWVDP